MAGAGHSNSEGLSYKTFKLADEPKIAGIPILTGVPVFFLTAFGLYLGYATTFFLIGAAFSLLLHFKFGGLPIRVFFSVVYWSFPQSMTALLFWSWPNSAHRFYVS